jgi:hypothetical protein
MAPSISEPRPPTRYRRRPVQRRWHIRRAGQIALGGTGWHRYRWTLADVNGDLAEDLVWNHTSDSENRTYVGRSNRDGTFTLVGPMDLNISGWGNYIFQHGDINRDGRADMIWTDLNPNRDPTPIHRALGRADGGISWLTPHQAVGRPTQSVLASHIGDYNGDGGADILWNELDVGVNHVWIGLGNVNGGFDFTPLDQEHPASAQSEDWTAFSGGVLVLDVTGDGRHDLVWNERSATNRIYVAVAQPSGS